MRPLSPRRPITGLRVTRRPQQQAQKPPRRFAPCPLDADNILGRWSWVMQAITVSAVIVYMKHNSCHMSRWSGGVMVRSLDLRLRMSRVRLPALRFQLTTLGKLFTHVPVSPSSIIWQRSSSGDALRLGELPQVWRRTGHASQTSVVYPPAGSPPKTQR